MALLKEDMGTNEDPRNESRKNSRSRDNVLLNHNYPANTTIPGSAFPRNSSTPLTLHTPTSNFPAADSHLSLEPDGQNHIYSTKDPRKSE